MKDQLEALILQMHKSGILYAEAVREFKKRFILTVLQENKGNQCKAARQLGMHRNTLSRTIAELNLDVRMLRPGARRPPRSARPLHLRQARCALSTPRPKARVPPGKTQFLSHKKTGAVEAPVARLLYAEMLLLLLDRRLVYRSSGRTDGLSILVE